MFPTRYKYQLLYKSYLLFIFSRAFLRYNLFQVIMHCTSYENVFSCSYLKGKYGPKKLTAIKILSVALLELLIIIFFCLKVFHASNNSGPNTHIRTLQSAISAFGVCKRGYDVQIVKLSDTPGAQITVNVTSAYIL